ncbi:HlyD family type I secretion periplasmic adaptor subunit [Sphingomonas sp. SUN039]|uniref:HlyD family type I secretion periplasmic adaptor subunit n=1 Tax=Sphingomonas sp. SUN039 TaxID=2937787 RepID=UPI0021649B0F|nr:HlyD family type I secretion periplasmic adaptor subunit [Sphingomonas sp. SUN039]UVO55783.1 HlyD family type I secretion periplasmic adaptor subunit [Sphingomonas sp. SUN039]
MSLADPHLEDLADRIEPRSASSVLLWTILGFFIAFILWASFVQIDRTVRAPGRIVPSARLQVVSHLEGGIVAAILVRAGDLVRQGQALVKLDPTQSGAELGSSEVQVVALQAKIARLEAEVAGREPMYPVPRDAAGADQVAIERALHQSRMSDLAALVSANSAREGQAMSAVAEAQAAYRARVSARDAAARQLAMMRPLVERGIEPQMTLVQLQNSASVAASEAAQAAASIGRAQSAVAEARATASQVRQNWRAQAGTELAAAQAEMAARSRTVPALAARLGRSTVAAPVTGRVNRVLVSTVGSSIAPGQPIVEVVPSNDTLTVEALVTPKDIGFVRIGQKAKVNVSAYDSAIYGGMDGEVVTISPDATVEERTGESHYTVRIRADAKSLRDSNGKPLTIGPGMTTDVSLLGDKRSIMAYILTPIARLGETAFRE